MSHDPHSYNRGVRDCIAWLHRRAGEMNDPHARQVLNSAAFSLGTDKPQFSRTESPQPPSAGETGWLPIETTSVDILRLEGIVDHFHVEAVDDDGGVHVAEFYGRWAEQQARAFSLHQYGREPTPVDPPRRMREPKPRPLLRLVPPPTLQHEGGE